MKPIYKNLILAFMFLTASNALAIGFGSSGDFSLAVTPEAPRAGSTFSVEARSFSFDVARANLQWLLNGKLYASGLGHSTETFTASRLGSNMTIRVIASLSDGRSLETDTTINISDIDILVRPLTYIPAFYRGAALATPGSEVEIYATPHIFSAGSKIAAKSLIYEWFLGDKKIISGSGIGKNKIILTLADIGGSEYEIKLKASSISGSVSSEKSIKITTQTPQILFYEDNSLTGRAGKAFSVFNLIPGGNLSILAEPYFLDLTSLKRAVFSWSANGSIIDKPAENPRLLEISAPQDSNSSTNFSLVVEDKKTIFQRSEATLTVVSTQ